MTGDATPSPETDVPAVAAGDSLPGDLDVTAALVGPYTFPDVARRRIAASLHALVAVVCAISGVASGNRGLIGAAVLLGLVALYHLACAWPLAVDQTSALAAASREVGFAVGHASAQVSWRGLRSRPLWRVLVYSTEEPPAQRGIVEVDAVDGSILFSTHERNPEDWSQFTA